MEWNKFIKDFVKLFIKSFGIIFILCIIVGGIKIYYNNFKKNNETNSPVERSEIDSITKDNNKIIIEVKSLDSIKNEKVIEVESLDNDSTLRLFYELIRK